MPRHLERLKAEIRRHGAVNIRVERGAKHPKLTFETDGERKLFVMAGTSGDQDIHKIELAQIRRLIGVRATAGRTGRGRRRAAVVRVEPDVECPLLTVFPDPFEPLGAVMERVILDCRCRCGGLDGVLARIERRGLLAVERIRTEAIEILRGSVR